MVEKFREHSKFTYNVDIDPGVIEKALGMILEDKMDKLLEDNLKDYSIPELIKLIPIYSAKSEACRKAELEQAQAQEKRDQANGHDLFVKAKRRKDRKKVPEIQ